MTQQNPEETKRSVAEFYDTHVHGRAGILRKLALAKKIRGKKVLDAGCGAGYFLFDYCFAGAEVTGVDISSGSIEFVRRQCQELGLPVTLIAGDLETISLPKHSFDYIFSNFVLQHTPHPKIVLANFRTWLKPGGEIYMRIAHKGLDSYMARVMIFIFRILPFKYLVSERTREGIHWEDRFEHPYWDQPTKARVQEWCRSAGLTITHMHCDGFTIFITAWIPPLLMRFIEKKLGNSWGKTIHVVAVANS